MLKKCEVCGGNIPRGNMSVNNKKYQAKRFCSAKCHHQSMRKEFEYKCAECGGGVIRAKENITTNVFCNDKCKGKYAGKHYRKNSNKSIDRVKKICENCNNPYEVIKSRENTSKYCSMKCRAESNAKTSVSTQQNRLMVKCNNCDDDFEKVPSDVRKLNFCSTDCMYNYYEKTGMFARENNGKWKGGTGFYRGKNWLKQRDLTRERDQYTCQKCGIHENDYVKGLSVHHIVPYKYFNDDYIEANKLENLISLCETCHHEIHSRKYQGTKYLMIPDIDQIQQEELN